MAWDQGFCWTVCSPDGCKSQKALSDPWRNLDLVFTLLPVWSEDEGEGELQEGCYGFTGIGGGGLVSSCMSVGEFSPGNIPVLGDSSGSFLLYRCSSMNASCSVTAQFTQSPDCGGGKVDSYHVPTSGIYCTREEFLWNHCKALFLKTRSRLKIIGYIEVIIWPFFLLLLLLLFSSLQVFPPAVLLAVVCTLIAITMPAGVCVDSL